MIAFFIIYEQVSSRVRKRFGGRPHAHRHVGNVAFVGAQIHLLREDGSVFCRRRKCTVFDDSVTPPRLIREDYELKDLRKLKAPLPPTYISLNGSIMDLKGNVVMEGPRDTDAPKEFIIQPSTQAGRWPRIP